MNETHMPSQKGHLEHILKLKEQHPDFEIRFLVSDQISDCSWTNQAIVRVEVSPWFEADEYFYTDVDEIIECMESAEPPGLTESELEEAVKQRYAEEVKTCICVYLEP